VCVIEKEYKETTDVNYGNGVQESSPTGFTGNKFCLLITAMNKVLLSHQAFSIDLRPCLNYCD